MTYPAPLVTIALAEYQALLEAAKPKPAPVNIPAVTAPKPTNTVPYAETLAPVIVEKLLRGIQTKQENLSFDDLTAFQHWLCGLADHCFGLSTFTVQDLARASDWAGVLSRYDVFHFACQHLVAEGRLIYHKESSHEGDLVLSRPKKA